MMSGKGRFKVTAGIQLKRMTGLIKALRLPGGYPVQVVNDNLIRAVVNGLVKVGFSGGRIMFGCGDTSPVIEEQPGRIGKFFLLPKLWQ